VKTAEIKPSHPKPAWVDRFVARLVRLQPGMTAATAAEHAAATFPGAADLQPGEAAEIFAAEEPPGEVGASR
jgi:hypothetical protein